jgi:FMN phosphatase YigB (HAD superfamily)
LGLPAAACVSIGNDYVKDIVPAKALAMWTVWLRTGDDAGGPAADIVIGSLAEVVGALKELGLAPSGPKRAAQGRSPHPPAEPH